jgi:hypothetical protein
MISVARTYLLLLCRAGVALRLRDREPGFAPSSNGFVRYALMKDLGPIAPVTRANALFDPNARKHIAYATRKAVRA